ncbi:MAG: diadenylate cyclase CdaA [Candidatus Limivicinus sp.]|jgi:diadenylate cyclase
MEAISSALNRTVNFLTTMGVADFVDIIIVAYLIYKTIWVVRRTNSHNLAKGIIVVLITLWLSEVFKLTMINYLLRKAVELGLIALLILFQPELRRLLERMGSGLKTNRVNSTTTVELAISQIVQACSDMSDSRTGALVIFERKVSLSNIIATGTVINADATAELIKNIFFNKAPLHDGALILRDTRLAAAGCVLPLTQNNNLSKELGMRHRAGIGLSEQSDALVIIVSEETGAISVALDGMLKRHLSPEALNEILHSELVKEDDKDSRHGIMSYINRFIKVVKNEEEENSVK